MGGRGGDGDGAPCMKVFGRQGAMPFALSGQRALKGTQVGKRPTKGPRLAAVA